MAVVGGCLLFACPSADGSSSFRDLTTANADVDLDQSVALKNFLDLQWSDEDLQMLQKMMAQQVKKFRAQLFQKQEAAQVRREKRSKFWMNFHCNANILFFFFIENSNFASADGDWR